MVTSRLELIRHRLGRARRGQRERLGDARGSCGHLYDSKVIRWSGSKVVR